MAPTEYNQALTHQRDSTLRFYFQNIDEALSQALQYDSDDIIDGSIPNSKLENSTVSFGGVTLSLGGVDATPAFNLVDATGYPTSSLVGTITNAQLAGSIANAKLSNSTVSYGGVQLALGVSDATPAFNLSDATAYPAGSLTGEIATAQIADDAVTDAKLANSINAAISANSAKVTNATHSGEVTGATALTIADGAVVTDRIADDAVTTAKIADDAITGAKIDGTTTVTAASVVVTPDGSSASSVLKLKATNNYTAELHFGDVADDDAGRIQYNNYANEMGFYVNNSQKAVFKSDGDLLIGTTSSGSYSAKLRVQGRIETSSGVYATSNGSYFLQGGNYGAATINVRSYSSYSSSTQKQISFQGSTGSQFGSIAIVGAATVYNTSSDERLKENIQDANDAGSKIDAIQIRQFDWISEYGGEHQDYGVIAQELLPVAPEAVSEGYTEDDMMSVDYSKLVPTLIKEIQSLRRRVKELENDK
jgi:hypothetical protein